MIIHKRQRPACKRSQCARVVVIFCLFAILGSFDLPLAPATLPGGLAGVNLPGLDPSEVSGQPDHDPFTYPVYENYLDLQDVIIGPLTVGSACSVFVQPLSFDGSRLKPACPYHLVSEPRAPPLAL